MCPSGGSVVAVIAPCVVLPHVLDAIGLPWRAASIWACLFSIPFSLSWALASLSCSNSAGTLRSESETERKPEAQSALDYMKKHIPSAKK